MHSQIQVELATAARYEPERLGSYRPKIAPRQLRRLWLEKVFSRKPIMRLVAEALDEYFARRQA